MLLYTRLSASLRSRNALLSWAMKPLVINNSLQQVFFSSHECLQLHLPSNVCIQTLDILQNEATVPTLECFPLQSDMRNCSIKIPLPISTIPVSLSVPCHAILTLPSHNRIQDLSIAIPSLVKVLLNHKFQWHSFKINMDAIGAELVIKDKLRAHEINLSIPNGIVRVLSLIEAKQIESRMRMVVGTISSGRKSEFKKILADTCTLEWMVEEERVRDVVSIVIGAIYANKTAVHFLPSTATTITSSSNRHPTQPPQPSSRYELWIQNCHGRLSVFNMLLLADKGTVVDVNITSMNGILDTTFEAHGDISVHYDTLPMEVQSPLPSPSCISIMHGNLYLSMDPRLEMDIAIATKRIVEWDLIQKGVPSSSSSRSTLPETVYRVLAPRLEANNRSLSCVGSGKIQPQSIQSISNATTFFSSGSCMQQQQQEEDEEVPNKRLPKVSIHCPNGKV